MIKKTNGTDACNKNFNTGVTRIRNEIEKNAIELIDSLKNICILHNLKRKLVILQIKHK